MAGRKLYVQRNSFFFEEQILHFYSAARFQDPYTQYIVYNRPVFIYIRLINGASIYINKRPNFKDPEKERNYSLQVFIRNFQGKLQSQMA